MNGTENDRVRDDLVGENREHVRTLFESLAAMGSNPDRETVDSAFRAAHSLKANCELAGLDDAAAVAHAVEDVLAAVRSGNVDLETTADEAIAAVETLERVVDGGHSGTLPESEADVRIESLRQRLDGADEGDASTGDEAGTGPTTEDATGMDDPDLGDLGLDEEAREALMAASDYDDLDALAAEMDDDAEAYADLDGAGSFDAVEEDAGGDGDPGDGTGAGMGGDVDDETSNGEVAAHDTPTQDTPAHPSTDGTVPDLDVAPWTDRAPTPAREAFGPFEGVAVPGAGRVADAAATIDATGDDRFDAVPTSGRDEGAAATLHGVRSLAVEERRLATALDDPDVEDDRVTDALASLRRATGALGEGAAADFRRLDAVTADLERAVATVARRVDTPVDFEADVAPVAVDRAVADRLTDPLVHCVRNAVDHGIEAPAEREAAGKPEAGTVTVQARREDGRLVVSVADDGRGVDIDAVREAALDAGHEDAAEMPDDAVLDLLFEAGLSTADADSDLSGRGVGMDVVGETIADLDGEAAVESAPGEGTTVRLAVPVDAVVERVLLVAVGAETYAVPAGAVRSVPAGEATVRDGALRVQKGAERDALGDATAFGTVREHPVVDLSVALDAPSPDGEATSERPPTDGPVYLLVTADDTADSEADEDTARPALRCDGVLAEHEAPVTPLRGVAAAPVVDGAVVCDAGRVVPTLAPDAFVDR